MTAYLEVWKPGGIELLTLKDARVTVGRGPGNDIPLPQDKTVSTLHAVVEPIADGWCVQDLGSRNGTYVSGKRLVGVQALRHGDEIVIGRTRIVFRAADPLTLTQTHGADGRLQATYANAWTSRTALTACIYAPVDGWTSYSLGSSSIIGRLELRGYGGASCGWSTYSATITGVRTA